ncbi:MAG: hypothetical protein P8I56_19935 [Paracoccaceae bacterium]|nr:hypothetical protein [Paracoccaceae bacterium]
MVAQDPVLVAAQDPARALVEVEPDHSAHFSPCPSSREPPCRRFAAVLARGYSDD